MDLHVLTSRGAVLVAQVVDDQLILPPPTAPATSSGWLRHQSSTSTRTQLAPQSSVVCHCDDKEKGG
jgi:hypothetical protein